MRRRGGSVIGAIMALASCIMRCKQKKFSGNFKGATLGLASSCSTTRETGYENHPHICRQLPSRPPFPSRKQPMYPTLCQSSGRASTPVKSCSRMLKCVSHDARFRREQCTSATHTPHT